MPIENVNFSKEEINVDELNFSEPTTETTENDSSVPVIPETKVETDTPKPVIEEAKVPEIKTEEPKEVAKAPETKVEPTENTKSDVKVTNPPTQYDGESDVQFNLRKQIYDAGQAKAMAETPEEKSFLSQHIKTLRKELGKPEVTINTPAKVETTQSQSPTEQVDEIAQAKKVLNEMGYISKDELPQYINDIVQGQSRQTEQQEAVRDFYSIRKDIAVNPVQREALERLVVDKFNITPQSTKQDLAIAMDMAATYLFPKQSQTPKVREAEDKRELSNFSSNTKSEGKPSDVDDKTREELKSLGWSDEDINREFQG